VNRWDDLPRIEGVYHFGTIDLSENDWSTKQALPPYLSYVKICACIFPDLLREVTDYPGKALNLKLGDSNEKGE
jgi:hypothetical protein